jgi:hypothetical protein
LIEKAKIKKAYSKIKASEQSSGADAVPEAADAQIHPQRQAMLDADLSEAADPSFNSDPNPYPPGLDTAGRPRRQKHRQHNKPGYYDKALASAEVTKAEREAREQEARRRTEERDRKVGDRERFRKAMVKAKAPGRDGQRRLGRESGLLLEKVKRMVG